jgi:hypothetical protein
MNRTGSILTDGVNFDLTHFGGLRTVKGVYRTGTLQVTEELLKLRPSLMPSWHAFTPEELIDELEKRGFGVKEISATGTMTRCVERELLKKIIGSSEYEEYLAFEEEFDSITSLLGMGGLRGSGLSVAAERHRGWFAVADRTGCGCR